jgi:hypothetical protein
MVRLSGAAPWPLVSDEFTVPLCKAFTIANSTSTKLHGEKASVSRPPRLPKGVLADALLVPRAAHL